MKRLNFFWGCSVLLEFHELNYIHLLVWSKCEEFFPVLYIPSFTATPTKENQCINEINDKQN